MFKNIKFFLKMKLILKYVQLVHIFFVCSIIFITKYSVANSQDLKTKAVKIKEFQLTPEIKSVNQNENKIISLNSPSIQDNSFVLDINFQEKIKEAEEELYSQFKSNKRESYLKYNKNRKDDSSTSYQPSTNKENQSSLAYYKIISLLTEITINKDKPYGVVFEKVRFELKKGTFTSIIRKFSLKGSSDSLIAFKLTSTDLKIKEARIISNCLESGELDPSKSKIEEYVCVIGIFEEVNAKEQDKIVDIEYRYIANNLLRTKESKNSKKNIIILAYDNIRRYQPIENIKLNIKFLENEQVSKLKKEDFNGEPNNYGYISDSNRKETSISWDTALLKENEMKKFMIEIPLFNSKCRMLVRFIK
jgi:hypothetical protein